MRGNTRTEWKQLIAVAAVAGGAAMALTGLRGQAQNRGRSALPHYVWLANEAIVAQPPHVVAGQVDLAAWSPDGRRVLAVCADIPDARPNAQTLELPPVETSVVLWNLATKRGVTVWKHRSLPPSEERSTVGSLSWLPASQTAVLTLEWLETTQQPDAQNVQKIEVTSHHALLLIDALREQAREVSLPSWLPFVTSPTKPQIVLHDMKEQTARILDSSGVAGPALALPKEPTLGVEWMPDGSALLLHWFEKVAGDKTTDKTGNAAAIADKEVQRFARMDAATGAITRMDKMPAPLMEKAPRVAVYAGPLHIRQTSQVLSEGAARHHTRPLWLECDLKSEQARTLLCADGVNAQMSPRGDAVLYLSQGVALVTPLAHLPREAFTRTLRDLVLRNAKQAAVSLLMYCQDYDEVFPATADVTSPYLRDDSVLDGLNYTYGGGALKDIGKPSETILGTYPGPGGVAILYADGHVKWKDK